MDKCHLCGKTGDNLWTFEGRRKAHYECETMRIIESINTSFKNAVQLLTPTKK